MPTARRTRQGLQGRRQLYNCLSRGFEIYRTSTSPPPTRHSLPSPNSGMSRRERRGAVGHLHCPLDVIPCNCNLYCSCSRRYFEQILNVSMWCLAYALVYIMRWAMGRFAVGYMHMRRRRIKVIQMYMSEGMSENMSRYFKLRCHVIVRCYALHSGNPRKQLYEQLVASIMEVIVLLMLSVHRRWWRSFQSIFKDACKQVAEARHCQ